MRRSFRFTDETGDSVQLKCTEQTRLAVNGPETDRCVDEYGVTVGGGGLLGGMWSKKSVPCTSFLLKTHSIVTKIMVRFSIF